MLRWSFKYGIVLLLFNTILLSIEFTYFIGNQLFLFLMVWYSALFLLHPRNLKEFLFHKAFLFFLLLNLINVFYFILFHEFSEFEAIKYLLARGMQFFIVSSSVLFHYHYFKEKFLDHVVYVVGFIVSISLIYDIDLFSGRYSGIIWNPNMLSSIVVIAFSILFLKTKRYSRLDVVLLLLFVLVGLATGSRGSIVAIVLAYSIKHGTAKRNMLYTLIAVVLIFLIVWLPFDTSVNRLFSESMFHDRVLQYKFAIESFYQKIYIGYGLDKYSYIDMSLVPWHLKPMVKGAHNGYLAIFTQYGIIFGTIILSIILKKSIQLINIFRNSSGNEKAYVFIIVYALVASLYESLLVGINEFHTILFWISLAFLSVTKFKKENHEY